MLFLAIIKPYDVGDANHVKQSYVPYRSLFPFEEQFVIKITTKGYCFFFVIVF